MKSRAALTAACIALMAALSACMSSSGRVSSAAAAAATRNGMVITVGSFDFPESVMPDEIYGEALAAGKFPVRILPDLGSREVVDPALMGDLVQLAPEYARSALGLFSLGRLSATSSAATANRALAASPPVAGRGLAAARPARVRDANAENITPRCAGMSSPAMAHACSPCSTGCRSSWTPARCAPSTRGRSWRGRTPAGGRRLAARTG
jgi:hypothetical protein